MSNKLSDDAVDSLYEIAKIRYGIPYAETILSLIEERREHANNLSRCTACGKSGLCESCIEPDAHDQECADASFGSIPLTDDELKDWVRGLHSTAAAERIVRAVREIRHLRAERERLQAEVDMLRGVGCNEDGDGPCGACIKCKAGEICDG